MIDVKYHIAFILVIITLMVITLVIDRFKTSMVFMAGVLLLLIGGVIEVEDFLAGLSNLSILTIFLLIIVTASINQHFNLAAFFDRILGKKNSDRTFLLKMTGSVAAVSAFMNNTPVVAMMMPYVYNWGKKNNINPSKLLIPLSYAAILGGMITLVGTSTNLVLNGLLLSEGRELLAFEDFIIPGLLVTIGCLLFMFAISPMLLKGRKEVLKVLEENTREYLVETIVTPGSPIIGLTVEKAGLRNLEGIFLAELVRKKTHYSAVSPSQLIEEGDVLMFAGETSLIFNLLNAGKGLELSKKSQFQIADNADVAEAIVTQNSTLDHKTVKDSGFREKYDAAIIGIHRKGEKVSGKIGHIELHTGDLLLLITGPNFRERNYRYQDLLVVNTIVKPKPVSRLIVALTLIFTGFLSLFEGLLGILAFQVLAGMLTLDDAKKNVSPDLLIVLIGALAIGQALISSGTAGYLMDTVFTDAASWSPVFVVCMVFLITFIMTSLVTNVAAISIVFPVVLGLAVATGVPEKALFLTAAYAASCCFVTPFAYQTNLMVMEAGNYRFGDFLRMGLPVSMVYATIFLTYIIIQFNLL
ncbi:MAG: SLC13 family permease [Owenweeksia sp.]